MRAKHRRVNRVPIYFLTTCGCAGCLALGQPGDHALRPATLDTSCHSVQADRRPVARDLPPAGPVLPAQNRHAPKVFITILLIMATFLLIHGAWHGGWCWRKVAPLLEASGHRALAPDLPGHGDDETPLTAVTLENYSNRICEIAGAQPEPVILVGHSMGGIAITQAAQNCPERIRALVYLCAFLPRNGDSLLTWATQDHGSMVNPTTVESQENGAVVVKSEHRREAFYGNCTDEDFEFAQSRLAAQPGAPFGAPVGTSAAGWGQIPRYYIECERDRAITLKLQREMQKHSPCRETFSIDTDHSPFLSAPESLVDILLRIARA
jgi:pimeloyl-ACP methyl ester carboxylesterase